MTVLIEHKYTRDLKESGGDGSWRVEPQPPAGRGWHIFDARPGRRTGWRRVRILWCSS